jgi:hypothetical protein
MSDGPLTEARLKTPGAAAIAGLVFSILLIAAFSLLRISVPADHQETGEWLRSSADTVALAINLIPFAGVAFLWFIGVLRDRLGSMEDRFFATIFLGSGLLYLGMLFVVSTLAGGILIAFEMKPEELIGSTTFHFARAAAYTAINVYLVKMATVFMITSSTVFFYTGIAPRWLAISGYALALLVLFGSYYVSWSAFVFPAWVGVVSIFMIIDSFRQRAVPGS